MQDAPRTIEWSDELSMHNWEIDAEHRHFIRMVNEFNDEAASEHPDKAEIERIMGFILEDAVLHFANEEQLFAEHHFPLAQEHAEIHGVLLDTLRQVLQQIRQSDQSSEWLELGMAIRDQLLSHILNHDTQYIEYLRTDGVEGMA